MIKNGTPIDLPVYSYVDHTRTQDTIHIEPKKVIILEGILLLTDARLREAMNFSIFVDTPLDICLMRRIKRDVNERGRSMDSVMAQYQKRYGRCSCNLSNRLNNTPISSCRVG